MPWPDLGPMWAHPKSTKNLSVSWEWTQVCRELEILTWRPLKTPWVWMRYCVLQL